jgi:hypothetical protein
MSTSKKRSRDDDDRPRLTGVDYNAVMDRQIGDKRFERERNYKEQAITTSSSTENRPAVSATFDAFQRMAAGLEGRKIADKIADPNRPTWEQYKKENEEKLDLAGQEVRKMVEYRAQLDKEREKRLKQAASGGKIGRSSSDDSDSSSDSDSESTSSTDSSRSRKKSRSKKHKKEKKSKKHKKHHKKEHKKSSKKDKKDDGDGSDDEPFKLSDFLRGKCD